MTYLNLENKLLKIIIKQIFEGKILILELKIFVIIIIKKNFYT